YAACTTALLFFTLSGIVIIHDSNKSLEEMLDESKLKTESIFSEKLMLDKEIASLKFELKNLTGMNQTLDGKIAETSKNLKQKEAEIKALNGYKLKNKSLENELAQIKKMRADLEKQVALLNKEQEVL